MALSQQQQQDTAPSQCHIKTGSQQKTKQKKKDRYKLTLVLSKVHSTLLSAFCPQPGPLPEERPGLQPHRPRSGRPCSQRSGLHSFPPGALWDRSSTHQSLMQALHTHALIFCAISTVYASSNVSVTFNSGSIIGVCVTFPFDLYSPLDAVVIHKPLSIEVQQLHLGTVSFVCLFCTSFSKVLPAFGRVHQMLFCQLCEGLNKVLRV